MSWQYYFSFSIFGICIYLLSAIPVFAVDTSDWDWGAIETATDTPTTDPTAVSPPKSATVVNASVSPPTTAPDFVAIPKPAYPVFPGMPKFAVIPSIKDTAMHPCGNCHRWTESNLTPRELKQPHNNFALRHGLHGKGQFWCFTCHDLKAKDGNGGLHTLDGEPLDYDESYVLCTQCHADKGRDWAFGAHGKRAENWQDERKVYTCTACHNQHAPAPKQRTAAPGPQMRQGLPMPADWVPKMGLTRFELRPAKPWEHVQPQSTSKIHDQPN